MINKLEDNSRFNLTACLERISDHSQGHAEKASYLFNQTIKAGEGSSNDLQSGNSVNYREKILNDLWKMIQRRIKSNSLLNLQEKEVCEIKCNEILSLIILYQIIFNRKDLTSIKSESLLDRILAYREEKKSN